MAKFIVPEISTSPSPSMDAQPILKEQYASNLKSLVGETSHDPHSHHNHKNAHNHEHQGNDHDFHGSGHDIVKAIQSHHKAMVSERAKTYLSKLTKMIKMKREEE